MQVNGGIFSDVLNVANPGAVRFAKDVLDEIVDIFGILKFNKSVFISSVKHFCNFFAAGIKNLESGKSSKNSNRKYIA